MQLLGCSGLSLGHYNAVTGIFWVVARALLRSHITVWLLEHCFAVARMLWVVARETVMQLLVSSGWLLGHCSAVARMFWVVARASLSGCTALRS